MPEDVKNLLGVPEATYLRPLLYGLRSSSAGLELLVDFPSRLAIKLQQRTDDIRCAFLSPIDYARHGGDYRIIPGVGVSSSSRTETIQLFINLKVRYIETIAVDIRVTSEIILAKIILAEKFPNLASEKTTLQFIPMLPRRDEMLRKADAALLVNFHPKERTTEEPFALDLVDEWNDLTGLPYVHGVWVGHDDAEANKVVQELVRAKEEGISHLGDIAGALSVERNLTRSASAEYLSRFFYGFGEGDQEGLIEFIKYAYYHGTISDVPDLNFFDVAAPPSPSVN